LITNFTRAFARYYGIKPSEVRLQKPDTEITPPHAKNGVVENNPSSQTQ
jgi:AraC-like DNA-binding protein